MREIQEHKIKIYEFPETDDEEESKIVKKIKVCLVIIVNEIYFLCTDTREYFQDLLICGYLND